MSISVIVVNYHTPLLFPALIEELKQVSLVDEIIVVDNSQDFRGGRSASWMQGVDFIVNDINKGFGAAVNQGVRCAGGDWILVVNPDVRIEKGCLEALITAAKHYGSSLVGPRFYWDDRHLFRIPPATGACFWQDVATISSQYYGLDADLLSFYWILRHERFWEATEPFVEPFLSGACLLVEKKWIEASGGKLFDESYFLYYEDSDLAVRAARDGIRPLCVPGANAIHYYDQSPSPDQSKSTLMDSSHYRFREKYYTTTIPSLNGEFLDNSGIADLGEISCPPNFQCLQMGYAETCYLEIGVNPCLVPFTQAEIRESEFRFPRDIWDRMAPGQYFGRIRGRISGIRKVVQWKKLP
ncbi:MAG: glycosyltransferase family 2 protein [Deltaproteobacteria bacterium]|nr:glycosyltransferase family 2 protein [Deltaproteobacteria bacterium]